MYPSSLYSTTFPFSYSVESKTPDPKKKKKPLALNPNLNTSSLVGISIFPQANSTKRKPLIATTLSNQGYTLNKPSNCIYPPM